MSAPASGPRGRARRCVLPQRRNVDALATAQCLPVHSLPTLLDDLATLALNTVHLPDNRENRFAVATQPTPLQRRTFELLDVDPVKMFPVRIQVE